jgi:succinoglycan biosynthesis protein ExoA
VNSQSITSEIGPEVVADYPSISVIIPVRNEAGHIEACLDSVLSQEYPPEQIEVLIADAMSDDGTRQIVRRYAAVHSNIHLLDNPGLLTPAGFNLGIRHAGGDYVALVSSHSVLPSDYLRKCVDYARKTDAQNVGGRMRVVGIGPAAQAIAMATNSPFGIGGSKFHHSNKSQYVDTVYPGFYPRQIFEEIGLFDERLIRNQDYELNYRLRAAGGKIYYASDIAITHYARDSWRKFVKQFFEYGYWKTRTIYKHPASVKVRHIIPPLFVGSVLVGLVLGFFFPMMGWVVLGLLGFYGLFLLYASWRTAQREGERPSYRLPFYLASLHIAWGAGALWGLGTLALDQRFRSSAASHGVLENLSRER